MNNGNTKEKILEIKDLRVSYITEQETVNAVNGVNLDIFTGESVGLVGETGAGKTTTCLSIMRLIPDPPGVITGGEIAFKGEDIIYASEKRYEEIRGNGISMIFQDPMTALNPVMTIGEQLMEVVIRHRKLNRAQAKEKVLKMLEIVGVKGDRFGDYPHRLSGGMKQRVVITMALLCEPELLIADEPTSALDVTIQAQVLEIIRKLQRDMGTSMLLVTHDLGVVAETCVKVAIMYAGEIVEFGTVEDVYTDTKHPYTRGLFDSIPKIESKREKLRPIEGHTPNPADLPQGCAFHPRCKQAMPICAEKRPDMMGEDHIVRCHLD
jgi:oligopeptide/dipeptide ABC transporter ATP-binding protein